MNCNLTPKLTSKKGIVIPTKVESAEVAIQDQRKSASAFEWPLIKDRMYSKYLRRFMFSFKNIYSENIQASNLMFVTGPTKCGKSVLLRHNLIDFMTTGKHVSISSNHSNNHLTDCMSCLVESCSVSL